MAKIPQRSHGFIGEIYELKGKSIGFIRQNGIFRMDGGPPGVQVDDDIYVHLNAFDRLATRGFPKPDRLRVGMVIAFFIGPSRNRVGRVTAEYCSLYELPSADQSDE
ncbi:MAG TPA: hypothetical protein VNM40_04355 [Candidatus Paceibacterota bacterium]|nr:hypothetical protein [Candidatus Paceibacterota bacterium]